MVLPFLSLMWVVPRFSFTSLGGVVWSVPSLGGVASHPFLLSGAVFPSLLSWCSVVVSLLRHFGWCCFFWEPATPKGGRGRQHDQKKAEAKQPHPNGRKDHHPTVFNITSVNQTKPNSFFQFFFLKNELNFIFISFKRERPPHRKEAGESSTTQGEGRKHSTTQQERGEKRATDFGREHSNFCLDQLWPRRTNSDATQLWRRTFFY